MSQKPIKFECTYEEFEKELTRFSNRMVRFGMLLGCIITMLILVWFKAI